MICDPCRSVKQISRRVVLLRVMGCDGAQGLLALRRAGTATPAQDRATSVVYGMSGAVAALGGAGQILPLSAIGAAMLRHCGGTARRDEPCRVTLNLPIHCARGALLPSHAEARRMRRTAETTTD
jgi:hypothetical protein